MVQQQGICLAHTIPARSQKSLKIVVGYHSANQPTVRQSLSYCLTELLAYFRRFLLG